MRISGLAWAILIALASTRAFAGTIVQSESIGLIDIRNSFAVPLPFSKFDPILGTLDSVTLELTASFTGTVRVENISGSPDTAQGFISGTVTASTNDALLSVEVFPGASGAVHDFTAFDGTVDFGGTSGATDAATGPAVDGSAAAPAAALSDFVGTGQIHGPVSVAEASLFSIIHIMRQMSSR